MTDVEKIKSLLDIADIVSGYIELKPAGTNLKAPCPFHEEKTPSFMVHRGKQIFHCFGCNTGGDMFTFIEQIENVDFTEALNILARKAGITLQGRDPKHESAKSRLRDILESATAFYESLLHGRGGESARDYLIKRGITEETISCFRIGFVPNHWDSLTTHLVKEGFHLKIIAQTGLVINKEGGTRHYDRFRGRIMFPITDAHGTIVGFSGRLLPQWENDSRAGGKYINTPETPIFHKAQILYGLNIAKDEIKKTNTVIFVEGQMDVISSHQANIRNTVASSGTAITHEQLRILKRYTENITFALDADSAGKEALKRAALLAWEQQLNPLVIELPAGFKDPSQLIERDPQTWKLCTTQSKPFMKHAIETAAKNHDTTQPEGKKNIARETVPLLAHVHDPIERAHYIDVLAEILHIEQTYIKEALTKTHHATKDHEPTKSISPSSNQGQPMTNDRRIPRMLALAHQHQDLAQRLIELLTPSDLQGSRYEKLYNTFFKWYTAHQTSHERFAIERPETRAVQWSQIELFSDKEYSSLSQQDAQRELMRIYTAYKKQLISDQLLNIERELKLLEQHGTNSVEHVQTLSQRFTELTTELQVLSSSQ